MMKLRNASFVFFFVWGLAQATEQEKWYRNMTRDKRKSSSIVPGDIVASMLSDKGLAHYRAGIAEDGPRKKNRRETQQLVYGVGYGAEFLSASDGCLGWDPIMDVVCGDGTNTIAEMVPDGIRLGDASAPAVSCVEHPELGRGAIRCRVPSIDPNVPIDNFDLTAFFLMGFFCFGPTEQSIIARATFLPSSLTCDAMHLAFHSNWLRVLGNDGLVNNFSCEPEETFGFDDDGTPSCLVITDCSGQSCTIPAVTAVQETPIPEDAIFLLGTAAPTQSPTTFAQKEGFWDAMFELLRALFAVLPELF